MKIVHVSDWHGDSMKLPEADVYVVTGDMLPNDETLLLHHPTEKKIIEAQGDHADWLVNIGNYYPVGTVIDRNHEVQFQKDWIKKHPFRELAEISEHARVVVVRGNHDYIDLEPWIGGNCFEAKDEGYETISFDGISFGGIRGICAINGRYADELDEASFYDRANTLHAELDVLVTHSPPKGILALAKNGEDYGSQALRRYVDQRNYAGRSLKAHLFGHVHMPNQVMLNGTKFSNAATTFNVIEL